MIYAVSSYKLNSYLPPRPDLFRLKKLDSTPVSLSLSPIPSSSRFSPVQEEREEREKREPRREVFFFLPQFNFNIDEKDEKTRRKFLLHSPNSIRRKKSIISGLFKELLYSPFKSSCSLSFVIVGPAPEKA